MKRYSLLFGIVGILAGLALIMYTNLGPKTKPTSPAELPAESLVYNVGTAHQLPGTEAMLYENSALGIRFGYPKSYGTVVVEKRDGGVFFSFSQTGLSNDPKRVYFMGAEYVEPTGHAGYWGDLSWFVQPDPRWMDQVNQADVCSLLRESSSTMPSWAGNFITSSTCSNLTIATGGIAKLSGAGSSSYLIPAFNTTIDSVSLDMYSASDERFMGKAGFDKPAENIERLVKSIEFIPPTE